MHNILPLDVIKTPLGNHDYLQATAASKKILPSIFKAAGIDINKEEYCRIANIMKPEEIHPEVTEKLDEIAAHWGYS